MSQKRMGFWDSLFALIPVIIYAAVYFVMVVVIGEENGGWNDFYGFATFIPWWVSAIALVPVSLLIATGIRALHNRSRDRRKAEETAFFTETFAGADVRKIVAAMARSRSSAKVLDIVVPTRVISILIKYSGSDCTMEEAAQIYLKEYLECSGVMNLDRFWI